MTADDRFQLVILLAALDEIVDQAEYFDKASGSDLADRWSASVEDTIQSLLTIPHRGSLCALLTPALRGCRHVPVKRFGRFSVFYAVTAEPPVLKIVAVLHMSQDIARILSTPRE